MIGHLPGATWEYVLKADRDAEPNDRPSYTLKTLSARELATIDDGSVSMNQDRPGHIQANQGSVVLDTLRMGLVGWQRHKAYDPSGKIVEVPFDAVSQGRRRGEERFVITDTCLDSLHPQDRIELCNAITEQTKLSEPDVKNLTISATSSQAS